MPDDDCQYWFCPFPVADIESTTQPDMLEQTPHIFCKTKRAKYEHIVMPDMGRTY
jgi:hypothetical protein